ncbi:MAG: LacI family DNA-binding transcriptional regulator [Lachnospiraceae bacterium]|nr:LacI family DNA-binding transcriptional regulator [Lachnospiraceae bacterium]
MTIGDIAKMAGVSPAAVSRFLNDGYVSDEKREKIKEAIEKTGYVPSRQAQQLRTKRTKLIGVIIPKIDSDSISRIVAGISEELADEGYQLLLANTDNDAKNEIKYLRTFRQNFVDGVILIATSVTAEHRKIIKSMKIPVVAVGQKVDFVSSIYHDDYGAAYAVTEEILKKGHKKVAFIGVPDWDIAVGCERLRAFRDCLADHEVPLQEEWILKGMFDMENGYENTKTLMEAKDRPDAIFCATDTIALGAVHFLNEHKIKIPEDVAVCGVGNGRTARVIEPPLTTADYFYRESGKEGAKMLLEKIENPKSPILAVMLGYEIIERESL